MPLCGSVCPVPLILTASTVAVVPVVPYRVRVQLACGWSVETGLWLTRLRLVHCLIASPKLTYESVVSVVPCHNCIRGYFPVYPGYMDRARSPHCCAVLVIWPPEHWLFHSDPLVVAKHPAGTPENAAA